MRREDLSLPRQRRRLGVHYDTDQFGQFSESVARFIGTARFLVFQSVVCVIWALWNGFGPSDWRFDNWPFIGLTLLLSLQAAYAAPLILLAQTRQEQRDRTQNEVDRRVSERTQADTEFLAREIASVRLAIADVATTGEIDDRLDSLQSALATLLEKLDSVTRPAAAGDVAPVSDESTSRPATA
jgi:uncharacterized membrane protein